MRELYVRFAGYAFRIRKILERILGIKRTVYVQERVSFYREMWAEAADILHLEFTPLSADFWEVRDAGRTIARLHNYVVSIDDPVTLDLAGDKPLVYRMFHEAGLPVPANAAVTRDTLDGLVGFMAGNNGPFVVKPARNTASGLGVTTGIRTGRQALRAAALAFMYGDQIVIEEHIAGESYRLLYLDNEFLCASRRAGLHVAGDGATGLGALIEAAVRTERKMAGWRTDPDIILTLERQELGFESVVAAGRPVLVRSVVPAVTGNAEVRTEYTEDVTSLICDDLKLAGRRASLVLGSAFCGVDIITTDPTASLAESGGVIGEINTTPGLHHHYGLARTQASEPLAVPVLRYLKSRRG